MGFSVSLWRASLLQGHFLGAQVAQPEAGPGPQRVPIASAPATVPLAPPRSEGLGWTRSAFHSPRAPQLLGGLLKGRGRSVCGAVEVRGRGGARPRQEDRVAPVRGSPVPPALPWSSQGGLHHGSQVCGDLGPGRHCIPLPHVECGLGTRGPLCLTDHLALHGGVGGGGGCSTGRRRLHLPVLLLLALH